MKLRTLLVLAVTCAVARAEDGYRLWLRYDRIEDAALRSSYAAAASDISLCLTTGGQSAITAAARRELSDGLAGMLGTRPSVALSAGAEAARPALGTEGYAIERSPKGGLRIVANG
ncbi:MAG TPA: alpha-glucuronidase family glycosyl hydrolase, partial [Opitutaceae bacterium]